MLSLLARIYGRGVTVRNYLYDKGILDVHDLGARTISIGNITVGGTGKTPLVAYVARQLAARGEKVCILTRGYGREDESKRVLVSDGERVFADARAGGDEPVELATKLLGKAIVVADADRVGAAEWARRKFGVTAFVLDDGFQHRKVQRDVDIVCVDATDRFGGRKLLPAGRLREPVENLARANVVVITRVEQVDDISDLRSHISDIAPNATAIECRTRLSEIRPITAESPRRRDDQQIPELSKLLGGSFLAFGGLGNPESFFTLLEQNHIKVTGSHAFPDHGRYTQSDIHDIERQARESSSDALITTAKDAVKLADLRFSLPCYVADIEIELDDPAALTACLAS
jgi:tetraacyldisaccharide 4'-kinase